MADLSSTAKVLRSVLVAGAVMVGVGSVWFGAAYGFNFELPDNSGSLTTLISTMAGAIWFRRKTNRPMLTSERLLYATGLTLLNAVIPIVMVVAALAWFGTPMSLAGFDLLFGGGEGYLLEPAFAGLMFFILVLVFFQAFFFGWLLTRNPRKRAPKAE
jgi:hypothetical protein